MNIDWSKAPGGFPLWLEGTNEEHKKHSGWYRDAGQVFEGAHGGQWRAVREGQFFIIHRKPESKTWDGEGYPDVEMICEYQVFETEIWRECEVVARRKGGWVVLDDECETAFVTLQDIRPIRTPEQIAAEEREGAIHEMVDHLKRWVTVQDLCGVLYDAGYRKVSP
jgi:hypothetical protein